MEGKTPVTLLQELLMKKHTVPTYSLILNGVGTHAPVFEYEVCALGQRATGCGKSKKEAKHNAAQQFFQIMKELDSTVKNLADDVTSPYEGNLKENAVGELQLFCLLNQLKLPEYEQTRDGGLPHAKEFSWKCTVSSFSTEATAKTKKSAKHMAAQDMLLKLKESLGDVIETKSAESDPYSTPLYSGFDQMDSALDAAIKRMPRTIRKTNAKGRLGLNLSDVCFAVTEENMPDLVYLDSIKNYGASWFESQNGEDFQNVFSKIADEMDCEFRVQPLESADKEKKVVALIVDSIPSWTFVATGGTLLQAVHAVFEEAVRFMVKMRI